MPFVRIVHFVTLSFLTITRQTVRPPANHKKKCPGEIALQSDEVRMQLREKEKLQEDTKQKLLEVQLFRDLLFVQQLLILNTLFLWLHPTDLDKQGL
jgi:hypothetical protein